MTTAFGYVSTVRTTVASLSRTDVAKAERHRKKTLIGRISVCGCSFRRPDSQRWHFQWKFVSVASSVTSIEAFFVFFLFHSIQFRSTCGIDRFRWFRCRLHWFGAFHAYSSDKEFLYQFFAAIDHIAGFKSVNFAQSQTRNNQILCLNKRTEVFRIRNRRCSA